MKSVLFLCTGNSARSILAEAYLNQAAGGRFRAYSAGSQPAGRVNPFALELLRKGGLPTSGARSKSWDEFARPDAPKIDFVFTVCDSAAAEVCPVWPGHPVTAHWGVPDPAAVEGTGEQKRRAFKAAFTALARRIDLFLALPMEQVAVKKKWMRSAAAEALGTALLLAAVVGSGIMGERLAAGNTAIALLANSLATGFALIALIIAFIPRSGAHFNPVVTLALAWRGDFQWSAVLAYVLSQLDRKSVV